MESEKEGKGEEMRAHVENARENGENRGKDKRAEDRKHVCLCMHS